MLQDIRVRGDDDPQLALLFGLAHNFFMIGNKDITFCLGFLLGLQQRRALCASRNREGRGPGQNHQEAEENYGPRTFAWRSYDHRAPPSLSVDGARLYPDPRDAVKLPVRLFKSVCFCSAARRPLKCENGWKRKSGTPSRKFCAGSAGLKAYTGDAPTRFVSSGSGTP